MRGSPGATLAWVALAVALAMVVLEAIRPAPPPPSSPLVAVPPPPSPPPRPALADLVGLSDLAVVARLGHADRRRRDPPAEVWQYLTGSCILDLFLYPDGAGQRVHHAAARDQLSGRPLGLTGAEARCLGALILADAPQ